METKFTTAQLTDYIDGILSQAETLKIEAALQNNEILQIELLQLTKAQQIIKDYGIANKVKTIHQQMMLDISKKEIQKPAKVFNITKILLRIAAILLVAFSVFAIYQYSTINHNNVFANANDLYTVNNTRAENVLDSSTSLYATKNYSAVIANFVKKQNASITETFLTGQSYLATNDYKNAISCFEKINTQNLFKDDVDYYKALAYLKNNDADKAYTLFEAIKNNKNHLYNDKVTTSFMLKLQLLKWKST
jgi:hypothetical protein